MARDFSLVESYTSKTAVFKFRGAELRFALSHGLFSSAGIDRGTAFLLKILSRLWDEERAAGCPPPRRVLDAGCGAGILAVCAGAALGGGGAAKAGPPDVYIRAQDRDELARLFTEYNARSNGIGPERLSAHTEALLADPPGSRWDLILSNIPAKAGGPVLEDFVRRSARLLNPGGKALMVAVKPLADFFRSRISRAGGELLREETGPEHTVFVYGAGPSPPAAPEQTLLRAAGPEPAGEDFLAAHPFYLRQRAGFELEHIPLRLDTIHGAAGFDRPGGAAEAAAKLTARLGTPGGKTVFPAAPAVLIHEPGQGWFPRWFLAWREREGEKSGRGCPAGDIVLSGRNVLALEAARHNLRRAPRPIQAAGETAAGPEISIVPAVELSPRGLAALGESGGGFPGRAGRFGFIAVFPEIVPRTDRRAALWEGLAAFLAPGGCAVISLPSSEAERLDRKKPPGFRRLGDLKRNGFRAQAYEKQ